jgi:hypothetical protein
MGKAMKLYQVETWEVCDGRYTTVLVTEDQNAALSMYNEELKSWNTEIYPTDGVQLSAWIVGKKTVVRVQSRDQDVTY